MGPDSAKAVWFLAVRLRYQRRYERVSLCMAQNRSDGVASICSGRQPLEGNDRDVAEEPDA